MPLLSSILTALTRGLSALHLLFNTFQISVLEITAFSSIREATIYWFLVQTAEVGLRDKAFKENTHRKLPEQVAFLQFALDTAISWMVDKNVLNEDDALTLSKEGWDIFIELSNRQAERLEREDPIRCFEEILQTLITQGKVRIEDKDISDPEKVIGGQLGDLIGYYDDLYLYLLPPALWHSLQRYCIAEGSHFPFSKNTFYRMLKNRKLIETRGDKNTIDVRLRGEVRRVLKFIDRGICGIGVTEVTGDANA